MWLNVLLIIQGFWYCEDIIYILLAFFICLFN